MADRDLKVTFEPNTQGSDPNVIHLPNNSCSCPNTVDINIVDMMPGKKYTVFITNLNNTPVRTFPESYSFVADGASKKLSFYYQFS